LHYVLGSSRPAHLCSRSLVFLITCIHDLHSGSLAFGFAGKLFWS
jgi:hypothetical protein